MKAEAGHAHKWFRAIGLIALIVLAFYVGTLPVNGLRTPAGGQEPGPVIFDAAVEDEPDPFVADLRAAAQLVRQRWAYVEHRRELDGIDLAALEAEASALLAADPGEEGFRRALTRFIAGLHDGHAGVLFSEFRRLGPRRWPLTLVDVAQGLMVDQVHPDVAGSVARGELVLAVDGVDIERGIAAWSLSVCASSARARRRQAIVQLARWTEAEQITLTIQDAAGDEREVELACMPAYIEEPRPSAPFTGREARWLEDGSAYFRPGDFAPPAESDWSVAPPEDRDEILAQSYADLATTLASFDAARALVLDLRGNPGGTDLLGQALALHLVGPGPVYFSLAGLGADGWRAPLPMALKGDPQPLLRCRLVCLIDELTFSVADNLAACLRDVHPDVTFIGRPTGAGTGAPRPFTLPRTGARIHFCTMRVHSPSGAMIEGTGVTPDLPVEWTREDVLEGSDPDLAAALDLLAG